MAKSKSKSKAQKARAQKARAARAQAAREGGAGSAAAENEAKSGGSSTPTPAKSTTAPKGRPTSGRSQADRAGSRGGGWWLLGLGVLIVVGVIGFAARDAIIGGGTGVTDADAWDLPALDTDERVRLVDFEGTPTVVNFFASWCTTCDQELPTFRDAAAVLEGEIDFVFVNSNENGDWRPMVERNGIEDLVLVKDIKGSNENGLYRSAGGSGGSLPITVFYDAAGNRVHTERGALIGGQLTDQLRELGLLS